jgi:hypothetical protein
MSTSNGHGALAVGVGAVLAVPLGLVLLAAAVFGGASVQAGASGAAASVALNTSKIPAAAVPREPVLHLAATAEGTAILDAVQLAVPEGVDLRQVSADAAVERARMLGRPARGILHDADGTRWPMIVTPNAGVFQGDRPLPDPAAVNWDAATGAVTSPGSIDPSRVPAWPHLRIELASEGVIRIDGEVVPAIPGFSPYASAIAAAAATLVAQGLNRPARATATDPDGTAWPLLIHPDGTASPAGDPVTAERSHHPLRAMRRRKDRPETAGTTP